MALAAGDAWLTNGANLLLFGPPGGGKSYLAAPLGFALVENGLPGAARAQTTPSLAGCPA